MSKKKKKKKETTKKLDAETKPKKEFSELIVVSLWSPSSPYLNNFDKPRGVVLENKTNATSHPNIGSLKTAMRRNGINV